MNISQDFEKARYLQRALHIAMREKKDFGMSMQEGMECGCLSLITYLRRKNCELVSRTGISILKEIGQI